MLAEANDPHVAREALEQVAHLERFAHVVVLVHVERLQVLAAREDDRVVLVLGLALADDRVARQLHLVLHLLRAVGVDPTTKAAATNAGTTKAAATNAGTTNAASTNAGTTHAA